MPLMLSKSFGLIEAQDRKLAHEFCEGVGKLIDDKAKYDDSIIIKTVDIILADIPKQDKSLKEAIMAELVDCYPDIEWSFKNELQHPELSGIVI